jgi:hypothetical protein
MRFLTWLWCSLFHQSHYVEIHYAGRYRWRCTLHNCRAEELSSEPKARV